MALDDGSIEATRVALSGAGPIPNAVLYNNAKDLAAAMKAAGVTFGGTSDPLPIGSVVSYSGATIPTGYLDADGSSQLRASYPDLFNVIGTTYGAGSVPGTTFALPNFVGTYTNFIIKATAAAASTTVVSETLIAVPLGSLQLYAGSVYPTGWLRADGTAISRTTYAGLFAIIGTTYGAGDGSTTFNLPNLVSSGTASPVYIIKVTLSGSVEPSTVAHASSHIRAGTDVIDGDRVQIDYVPTAYTRDAAATGAGAVTDLTAHLGGISNAFVPPLVTSLPVSPIDGQIIYYRASASDGVIWQLRYNASSASAYKWEFIGGGSLFASVGSDTYGTWETYSSLTYGDLATVGPSIVAPLAGEYICRFAVTSQNGSTSSNVKVWVTGDTLPSWTSSDSQSFGNITQVNANHSAIRKRTVPAAGNTVKLIYAVSNAGVACNFWHRRLDIQPIRVG